MPALPLSDPSITLIVAAIAVRLGMIVLVLGGIGYLIYLAVKKPSMEQDQVHRTAVLKSIYFYLASFVGLMMLIIAAVNLLSIVLKATIFVKADYYPGLSVEDSCSAERLQVETPKMTRAQCEKKVAENIKMNDMNRTSSRQNDLAFDFGLIIAGAPLFAYHFMQVQGIRKARKKA